LNIRAGSIVHPGQNADTEEHRVKSLLISLCLVTLLPGLTGCGGGGGNSEDPPPPPPPASSRWDEMNWDAGEWG
jgi:hypothetical protein